jgi:hypothetical protein
MTRRRFPPWTVEEIPGGFKVIDQGQSLAYCYMGREKRADADIANADNGRSAAHRSQHRQAADAAGRGGSRIGVAGGERSLFRRAAIGPSWRNLPVTFRWQTSSMIEVRSSTRTSRVHRTWLEKLMLWPRAYQAAIWGDEGNRIIGRGRTREAAQEAVHRQCVAKRQVEHDGAG